MTKTKPGYGVYYFKVNNPVDKSQEDIMADAAKMWEEFDALIEKYGGHEIVKGEFEMATQYADEHPDEITSMKDDGTIEFGKGSK